MLKMFMQKTLAKVNVFLFIIFYSIKTKYESLFIILSFKMDIFAKTYCFLENFGLSYFRRLCQEIQLVMRDNYGSQ